MGEAITSLMLLCAIKPQMSLIQKHLVLWKSYVISNNLFIQWIFFISWLLGISGLTDGNGTTIVGSSNIMYDNVKILFICTFLLKHYAVRAPCLVNKISYILYRVGYTNTPNRLSVSFFFFVFFLFFLTNKPTSFYSQIDCTDIRWWLKLMLILMF